MSNRFEASLSKLTGPLLLESRTGYEDSAVLGGVGPYVGRWASEAASACEDDGCRTMLEALAEAFSRYGEAAASERREMVRGALELLRRLGVAVPGQGGKARRAGEGRPAARGASRREGRGRSRASGGRAGREGLLTPVQYLKGVGPRRAEALAALGIRTVLDLLYNFPRAYEDRRNLVRISQIELGEQATICGRVVAVGAKRARSRLHILDVAVDDGSGVIHAVWFNQPFREKQFSPGQRIVLTGRTRMYGGDLQIAPLDFQILSGDDADDLHMGRIVPIYPLTRYVTQRVLRPIVRRALDEYGPLIEDFLPEYLIRTHGLMPLRRALESIHFPEDDAERDEARRRLVFDEFLLFQLALRMHRIQSGDAAGEGISQKAPGQLVSALIESLPFELTEGQKRAIEQVRSDMASERPMSRLVHGDVGSGKTIVAMAAALAAAEAGNQTAVMAPTEILAEQHFLTFGKWCRPLGVKVELLVGGTPAAMRREVLQKLADGSCDIVVGTHALLEEEVRFRSLGLVIIDEQHRFGVAQRGALFGKGSRPDLLVMTATPIPRTLALTLYGDLDVSAIEELPPGRLPVQTLWARQSDRETVYDFVAGEVRKGRQAYVILPLVEEKGAVAARAATTVAENLSSGAFAGLRVGLLHGRMAPGEKDAVMRAFRDGEIQVLVATTVVEVGVDVPNASVMVIENAERFGLAQLHQLRGRVGRGEHQSYCILIGDPTTPEASQRLSVMVSTTDGFEIAEEDLQLRGPGHFLGTRQHGMPELAIGDLTRDLRILEIARDEAGSLLRADPDLSDHPRLRKAMLDRFGETFSLIA